MRRNFYIRCTVLNSICAFTPFLTCLLRNKALKPYCVTDYYNFFCNGYYTNFVSLKQSLPLFLNLSETFTARETVRTLIVGQVFLQRLASNICHSEINARLITDFSLRRHQQDKQWCLLYSIFYLLLFSNVITQSLSL
jgi:hypothetical protein